MIIMMMILTEVKRTTHYTGTECVWIDSLDIDRNHCSIVSYNIHRQPGVSQLTNVFIWIVCILLKKKVNSYVFYFDIAIVSTMWELTQRPWGSNIGELSRSCSTSTQCLAVSGHDIGKQRRVLFVWGGCVCWMFYFVGTF